MATLNFTVTASDAEFNNFADRLGYMTTTLDGQGQVIPNPETRQQFLVRILKEDVSRVFYTPFVNDVTVASQAQVDADKENWRETVRSRVAVTYDA